MRETCKSGTGETGHTAQTDAMVLVHRAFSKSKKKPTTYLRVCMPCCISVFQLRMLDIRHAVRWMHTMQLLLLLCSCCCLLVLQLSP